MLLLPPAAAHLSIVAGALRPPGRRLVQADGTISTVKLSKVITKALLRTGESVGPGDIVWRNSIDRRDAVDPDDPRPLPLVPSTGPHR
jgi:hypothetical protein